MSRQIVQKLWNYCNILRDDGLSYGYYVEQLTFLLFLKMADEQPPTVRKREARSRLAGKLKRRLSVVEELEAVMFANLQRAARLRQSILQKAFTGQLIQTGGWPSICPTRYARVTQKDERK